jgi:hypothetical protein
MELPRSFATFLRTIAQASQEYGILKAILGALPELIAAITFDDQRHDLLGRQGKGKPGHHPLSRIAELFSSA